MAKMGYYAVKEGRNTGIFTTWSECEKQIKGFSGAIYKKFPTEEEAFEFIDGYEEEKKTPPKTTSKISTVNLQNTLYAYVDGSYNSTNNISGYGLVLVRNDKVLLKDLGAFRGDSYSFNESRNVFGELRGAIKAVELAIANNFKEIVIVYDYEGIEEWVEGNWKAKKELTKDYQEFMTKYKNFIDIQFIKVKAHSGESKYNDIADKLAKKAVNL